MALESLLGYSFSSPELLRTAVTHRSWTHEAGITPDGDNERLEFFGDALVDFLVAEELFRRFPDQQEGSLSRMRADLVSEEGLALLARSLGIGPSLRLGRGEEASGGRDKPSLLADACEAVIGAIYLDGGLEPARKLLQTHLFPLIEAFPPSTPRHDCKTALQELLQSRGEHPVYTVTDESGPHHARVFQVDVLLGDSVLGTGSGSSKKAAQQAAAGKALQMLLDSTGA